jgi:hypothetical protein
MVIYYRFSSIEKLENQSVLFASPEKLNDPVEGFRDIYWHGDLIGIGWRTKGETTVSAQIYQREKRRASSWPASMSRGSWSGRARSEMSGLSTSEN